MNQLVRTTLVLEQYQCRRCGRLFYINTMDRSSMDFDFGCPYGCDDSGRHVRDIKTGEVIRMGEKTRIDDYKITIALCEGDFERSMGRKPKDQEEFNDWAALAEKGLLNGHIDWDIIYECTKDAMFHGQNG